MQKNVGKGLCLHCPMRPLSIFAKLELDILEQINFQTTVQTFQAGDALYLQGDPSHYAYTLRSGLIKLNKTLANGKSQIIRLHRKGDLLGMDAFAQMPYNHDAVALTDTEVCRLPIDTLHDLRKSNDAIDTALLQRWNQSLRGAEDMMLELGAKKAPERLSSFLLRWCSGEQDNEWIDLPLSRSELGELLGLTLETVSRFLSDWKKKKLITETHHKIQLLQPDALKSIADPLN